ncbi:MAG TPA: pseudouridine synthase, partial [Polyangiaceae bacterium]
KFAWSSSTIPAISGSFWAGGITGASEASASTNNPMLGRESITHVFFREALKGATFVECRLETGRTHQIRIHLSEAGHPLVGERVYAKNNPHPTLAAPRLMLHALQLGFRHPVTNVELDFEQPLPEDILEVLGKLRR